MSQEISSNIIKFIIAAVIIVFAVWFLFFGPGKQLLANVFTSLPKEVQEESENRFDTVIRNIERCRLSNNNDCLCEVFPSWPAAFVKDSNLAINSNVKNSTFNLLYKEKPLKNATINNLIISAKEIENLGNVPFKEKKEISWKTEPPLFVQEGVGKKGLWLVKIGKKEYKVISSSLYKYNNELYLLISSSDSMQEIENKLKTINKC